MRICKMVERERDDGIPLEKKQKELRDSPTKGASQNENSISTHNQTCFSTFHITFF